MSIEVHKLVEQHISKWLERIFCDSQGREIPAALVVFDSIAKLFRFGGYNEAFSKIFGVEQLSSLIRAGMNLEHEGLIPYAVSQLKHSPNNIWAYSMPLETSHNILSESNITKAPLEWREIPAGECQPGEQLVRFTKLLRDRLRDEAKDKRLVLVPFSSLNSEEGLVLVASIERDLSIPHIPKLLEFLESQGVLLSAYQNILRVEIEQGNSEGYRRLARLIKHEENGFIETFEALVADLKKVGEDRLREMKIDARRLQFLENRMVGKKQLSKEMSGADPVNEISFEELYGKTTNLLSQLPTMIEDAERVFKTNSLEGISVTFGEGAKQNSLIRLDPSIIDRLIRNTVKNSFGICAGDQHTTVQIFVDVITRDGRPYLELRIADDAGGLGELADVIPRRLTPQIWTVFCSQRPDLVDPEDGVGFWAISRYAQSAEGEFRLEDVHDSDGEVIGLCCHITIGLADLDCDPEEDDFIR
jgi:hypothetical protein